MPKTLDNQEGCQHLRSTGIRCAGRVVLRVVGPHLLMVTQGHTKAVVVSHVVDGIDIRYCERHIPPVLRDSVNLAIRGVKRSPSPRLGRVRLGVGE